MNERRKQGILFSLLFIALSVFLAGHSLIVEVDFHACFENYAASINGQRPFHRVSEMSFGELAGTAKQRFARDQIIIAILGLLPLTPFLTAWRASKSSRARKFWIVSALVALVIIVVRTSMTSLLDFYDCDLNGVSLAIALTPVAYMVVNLVATLVLAAVLFMVPSILYREGDDRNSH